MSTFHKNLTDDLQKVLKHTSIPWKQQRHLTEGLFITGGDEFESVICQIREYLAVSTIFPSGPSESNGNAELIVRSVNCHTEMLSALKCAQTIFNLLSDEIEKLGFRATNVGKKIDAAIDKAEGR